VPFRSLGKKKRLNYVKKLPTITSIYLISFFLGNKKIINKEMEMRLPKKNRVLHNLYYPVTQFFILIIP
jgi:hypothetical protein